MDRKEPISFETFQAVDIRGGRVVRAEPFPEARNPSIKLWVDFGAGVGVLASSAQLTHHYSPEDLVDTPVLGVVNLPPLQIAGFRSECLVVGLLNPDDPSEVLLVRPDPRAIEKPEVTPEVTPEETKGWPLG